MSRETPLQFSFYRRFFLIFIFVWVILPYRSYIFTNRKRENIMNTIGNIIATARKQKHMSQPELSEALHREGIDKTVKAISKWESGVTEPSCSIFLMVCRILGITDVYDRFFGDTPEHPITMLNDEGRRLAENYINLLVESGKYEKPAAEIISFPPRLVKHFMLPASAGPGEFLDSDDYEMVDLPDHAPKNTDFIISVLGDSMEPQFFSGQQVFVKHQDSVENNEVGIFYLNGHSYIKKMRSTPEGNYLISLNPKYDPIPIGDNDSFKTFGKVLG